MNMKFKRRMLRKNTLFTPINEYRRLSIFVAPIYFSGAIESLKIEWTRFQNSY